MWNLDTQLNSMVLSLWLVVCTIYYILSLFEHISLFWKCTVFHSAHQMNPDNPAMWKVGGVHIWTIQLTSICVSGEYSSIKISWNKTSVLQNINLSSIGEMYLTVLATGKYFGLFELVKVCELSLPWLYISYTIQHVSSITFLHYLSCGQKSI